MSGWFSCFDSGKFCKVHLLHCMEEQKDAEIKLSADSSAAAASSFEENVHSLGNPLSSTDEKVEANKQNAEINHSETPLARVTDGSALEPESTGPPVISNETGHLIEGSVAASLEVQCSL